MKIVIAGGTGQLGHILTRAFRASGDQVVVLSRNPRGDEVGWDAASLGDWATEVDGSDVVINLAGRSVNCRYTADNLDQMMSSRVESTRAIGAAIAVANEPPKVWLQMSTATIYAHRFDADNDEHTGVLGGDEPDAPAYWKLSIDIATAWERTQRDADTPHTRKVAMRTAMVMSPDRGGVFDVLLKLVRRRLGGAVGGGRQYVSWIHEHDFVRAVRFLIANDAISGPVNLTAPNPLPQRDFMRTLREAANVRVGLPAATWMAKLGAWLMRTDTELILKSRRVVPARLREAGFDFEFETWQQAAPALVAAARAKGSPKTKKGRDKRAPLLV